MEISSWNSNNCLVATGNFLTWNTQWSILKLISKHVWMKMYGHRALSERMFGRYQQPCTVCDTHDVTVRTCVWHTWFVMNGMMSWSMTCIWCAFFFCFALILDSKCDIFRVTAEQVWSSFFRAREPVCISLRGNLKKSVKECSGELNWCWC